MKTYEVVKVQLHAFLNSMLDGREWSNSWTCCYARGVEGPTASTNREPAGFKQLDGIKENEGAKVAQWLRCCATNRKIAGSIPDGVIGIFHSHNPSDRTMALGSTQPLTEMSKKGNVKQSRYRPGQAQRVPGS